MGFEPTTPTLARLCSVSEPVGLRPTASQGAMRRAGLADRRTGKAKADVIARGASQSVYTTLRSFLRGYMSSWPWREPGSTAMKIPWSRDRQNRSRSWLRFAKKWFIRSAFHDELALCCLPEYFGEAHHSHRAG